MQMSSTPVIDLHCDLLFYLASGAKRTAEDLAARCALPQLRQGNVKRQTLAIFTQTGPQSVQQGLKQAQIYQELLTHYSLEVRSFVLDSPLLNNEIEFLPAFENASGFCYEQEPLHLGIKRLNALIRAIGKPLYISLTWNSENRFGGGALTKVGLKEDGKRLLDELHQKQIAVDFSHTSDALAYEILEYIDVKALEIPLLASHSNARAIKNVPRNLPDEIAHEICLRGGIIGLNFIRDFLGESETAIIRHVSHFLELGATDQLALGGDFFCELDLPAPRSSKTVFFDAFQDASCYGNLLAFVQKELRLPQTTISKIAHENASIFINKIYQKQGMKSIYHCHELGKNI